MLPFDLEKLDFPNNLQKLIGIQVIKIRIDFNLFLESC